MKSRSLTYMPALDGARAVAVGLVFVHHAFIGSFPAGALGVDVFFVISGFLITRILLKQVRGGGIRFGRFYLNRAVRLYPPLIVTVAAMPVAGPLLGVSVVNAVGGSVIALTYTSNIVMTFADRSLLYLSHTWSLAMEEQFYLLWPAFLALMVRARWPRHTMAAVTAVVACLSLAGWVATGDVAPYDPLTRAGGLLLGCALSLVAFRKPWESRAWAVAGLVGFGVAVVGEQVGAFDHTWSLPIATLAVVPVVAHLAFGSSPLVRGLSHPAVVYIGVISYEVYLIHYPVLWALQNHTSLPTPVSAVVGLVVTLALAALVRRWVGVPTLAWRDRRIPDAPATPVAA